MINQKKIKDRIMATLHGATEGSLNSIGSVMADSLAGQVLPGVAVGVISYRQKRMEQNLLRLIGECQKKQEQFEEKLNKLNTEQLNSFKRCFDIVADYVVEEPQEEKIRYMVNGLLGIAEHETVKEDFVLHYYDVLSQLRLMDIDILITYYQMIMDITDVLEKHGLDYEQFKAIREKLARMGLLKTRYEDQLSDLYENMLNIQNFLEDGVKGKKAKLKRLNRLNKRDAYSLSEFGRKFIHFFIESN